MSFRLSHVHEYDRCIAIDLGSYRIRSHAYSLEEGVPVLLGRSNLRQNRKNFLDGTISDLHGVAQALQQSLRQISSIDDIWVIDEAILSFSSENCISDRITTQYLRTNTDVPIRMAEIDEMIAKVEWVSFERARLKAGKLFGIEHHDIKLISSSLTAIFVDGKRVSNPLGFTGREIRIEILNIFLPAGEYNILRSVVSTLWKNVISLVPLPITLPKMVESSDYYSDTNLYIDIGHHHTTVVFEKEGTILGFDTFWCGTKLYLDMLSDQIETSSFLELESIAFSESPTEERKMLYKDFSQYITDAISGTYEQLDTPLQIENIFFSGGLMDSDFAYTTFREVLQGAFPGKYRFLRSKELLPVPDDTPITFWLAQIAAELLVSKKDPVLRVLRYVLYHYE